METVETVLAYWLRDLGEQDWYAGGTALDAAIRTRFAATWQAAQAGKLDGWQASPNGVLAFLIVTDQMARNMHRGTALAFTTDPLAHAAADRALARGWDLRIAVPERQFFYTAFMHGETMADQNRSVACYASRFGGPDPDHLLHARAHREVIRKYGRFPTRNQALGRENSAEELAYLAEGGYSALIKALKA